MSDTFEVQDHILTTQEILTDYVSLAGAAEIFGASDSSARRYIKEYDLAHPQEPIKTLGHTMNRGITKFYLRKDVQKVHELLNLDKKVTKVTPVPTKPSQDASEDGLEASYACGPNWLTMTDKEWQQVARILAKSQRPIIGILTVGVLILMSTMLCIAFFLYRYIEKDRVSMAAKISALTLEYRDSRLIQKIDDEQQNFFGR